MTVASIVSPKWVSYTARSPSGGGTVHDSIGLHRRCTSAGETCVPFPDDSLCASGDGDKGGAAFSFCAVWRTAGFLLNFAAVAELATLVGFLIIMAGGKVQRQGGWKILAGLLVAVAVVQFLGMAFVVSWLAIGQGRGERDADKVARQAYLFDHHDFFLVPGYYLDSSWYLCTVSAAVALLAAFGLAVAAFVLPPEGGYQLLGDSTAGGGV